MWANYFFSRTCENGRLNSLLNPLSGQKSYDFMIGVVSALLNHSLPRPQYRTTESPFNLDSTSPMSEVRLIPHIGN